MNCYNRDMKQVVIGLIYKDHKLCVAKRLSEPFKGYMECPGGKVEINESLSDALKRELYEEVELIHFDEKYLKSIDVLNEFGAFKLHFFKVTPFQELNAKVYHELFWVEKQSIKTLNWIPHNLPHLDFFIQADD
jgi:8-oxo-dGTP diphosphatase